MTQTPELEMLPLIEIHDPAEAKSKLPLAEQKLSEAVAGVEEAQAEYDRRLEVEKQDRICAEYLRGRIAETRRAAQEKRTEYYGELFATRETCDAASLAENLRRSEDAVSFYVGAHSELVEVLQGLHILERWEALVGLNRAKYTEADARVSQSHLATMVMLEAAFQAEGRLGVVGQRTQDLLARAKESYRILTTSEKDLADSRAAYERQQSARFSKGVGVITKVV